MNMKDKIIKFAVDVAIVVLSGIKALFKEKRRHDFNED